MVRLEKNKKRIISTVCTSNKKLIISPVSLLLWIRRFMELAPFPDCPNGFVHLHNRCYRWLPPGTDLMKPPKSYKFLFQDLWAHSFGP
jgi:hypothetical protein